MSEPVQFEDLPVLHPPDPRTDPSETLWTLVEDWDSPPLDGFFLRFLKGYQTDGASIPRIAWTLIGSPMDVPLLGPALCHDGLYSSQLTPDHSTADWKLLQYMQMTGQINWVKRNAVWSAVRSFGWVVWNRHTLESIVASRQLCYLLPVP